MNVDPAAWRPIGVEDLEPAAWDALRSEGSTVVVAGPGAGKTEFLAQRAAYLLQTGICPVPQRILAISFKTDAAKNLRTRVQSRIDPRQARRLDSLTFDAFTKLLVDRFKRGLRHPYRLDHGYDLWFPKARDYRDYLSDLAGAAPDEWRHAVAAIQPNSFEPVLVGCRRLDPLGVEASDGESFAIRTWWDQALPADAQARLTFTNINRLAELLVRTTPQIRRALWTTYPFVFVDECQDTTAAQFDLLTSLFGDSPTRVTAVGDSKQRIMGWAGALADALTEVAAAFGADRFPLVMNHRSVPDLISLQRHVAWMLEPSDGPDQLGQPLPDGTDAAGVWSTKRITSEVERVAADISARLAADDVGPSDCAILVRQTPEVFEPELAAALNVQGMGLRNEAERIGRSTLQDLLVEELTKYVVAVVRVVAEQRNPEAWSHATQVLRNALALDFDDETAARRMADHFDLWVSEQQTWTRVTPVTADSANELVTRAIDLVGEQSLRSLVPSYQAGDSFEIAAEALRIRVGQVADGQSWQTLADAVLATGSVPMLTVHKSKGLEFEHVYFLGLDDRQWWAHEPGEVEGVSTFFVGLSRARQTARFCFCEQRGPRIRVAEFLDTLVQANVPVEEFG